MPTKLILLNFMFFMVAFVYSAQTEPILLLVIILATAGMATNYMNQLFFGTLGTEEKMLLSYLVFFLITFAFVTRAEWLSDAFGGSLSTFTYSTCNWSDDNTPIIGALIHFVDMISCGLTHAYEILSAFFGISTTYQIIDTILLLPMGAIAVFWFIKTVKP